ncbi:MAG TPA: four helix bundle protein [Flavobacteriales bacterium]|nr:four helix bundle protein [Flavobacteriales bacterium]
MGTIKKFEELEMWQRARKLNNEIYNIINYEKLSKDYKLKEQMNGSCGSIMDNIAEGFERDGTKEFKTFLGYSKGSSGELKSQLYRALDRGYITKEEFDMLYDETHQIGKMINGFMTYLRNTEFRGNKFKEPETPHGLTNYSKPKENPKN